MSRIYIRYLDNESFIDNKCIVIKADFSIGILGIVASQLVEKVKVPVLIVTEAKDKKGELVLKGSCRSISGIDIFSALKNCEEFLIQFGGHKMAAGITLHEKDLSKFRKKISEYLKSLPKSPPEFEEVDMELSVERALSDKFLQQLQLIEPFGIGNKKPVFYSPKAEIQDIKRIGQVGDHLMFNHRGKYQKNKCVAFQFGKYENQLKSYPEHDLIYTVALSRFKKAANWQIHLVDIV